MPTLNVCVQIYINKKTQNLLKLQIFLFFSKALSMCQRLYKYVHCVIKEVSLQDCIMFKQSPGIVVCLLLLCLLCMMRSWDAFLSNVIWQGKKLMVFKFQNILSLFHSPLFYYFFYCRQLLLSTNIKVNISK